MQKKLKAFSLVEIIITISIITVLVIMWVSSKQWYEQNNSNAKIISDLQSINNALESYLQEYNSLPQPDWNTNFYKSDTTYAHSYTDTETFWVYGSITENTIPNKYIVNTPIDPNTNSYYSYWKTKNSNQFEIAAVERINNEYKSKVLWNYTAENGPYNLIRQYNWPNFVSNNSDKNFPYNPEQFVFTAKINKTTWNIEIQNKNGNTINNLEEITNYNIQIWDKIIVSIWATAQIYFSDWSTSVIWDKNQETIVTITDMMFKSKNNLSTMVKLFVSAWSIWTKATHLNTDSQFEVSTNDTNAAVRWTIFWIIKNSINTQVIVIEWEVDILKNETIINSIEVKKWQEAKNIKINWSQVIESIETEKNIPVFETYIDNRTTETINNIITENNSQISINNSDPNNVVNTSNNVVNTSNNNATEIISPTDTNISDNTTEPIIPEIIPIQSISKNWYWCEQCPNWYDEESENRLWIACKNRSRWSANERTCIWVIWNDWKEVICAIEKPKTRWYQSGCSWRNSYNWTWTYQN